MSIDDAAWHLEELEGCISDLSELCRDLMAAACDGCDRVWRSCETCRLKKRFDELGLGDDG